MGLYPSHSSFFYCDCVIYSTVLPRISEIRNSTMKIKNNTFAIPAAPAAMPPKPNIPAMIATIRNMIVHRNILLSLKGEELFTL